MDFEFSLKNKRVKMWLALMVPTFILSLVLFNILPSEIPSVVAALPLIIGYFIYLGWVIVKLKPKDE